MVIHSYSMKTSSRRTAPGPKGLPFLGSLLDLRRDPIHFLTQARQEFGDVIRLRLGPETMYVISRPEHVQHIFQDHHKNYGKQTRAWREFRTVVGNGLLGSEGEFWRQQRRIAQPAFHRERVVSFATVMT